ncbi:MAG: hypothetical protein JF616_21615 [Fibrobacteres bacterium]|nr:hypothetical protein [Fibrobacterota bacterium]
MNSCAEYSEMNSSHSEYFLITIILGVRRGYFVKVKFKKIWIRQFQSRPSVNSNSEGIRNKQKYVNTPAAFQRTPYICQITNWIPDDNGKPLSLGAKLTIALNHQFIRFGKEAINDYGTGQRELKHNKLLQVQSIFFGLF